MSEENNSLMSKPKKIWNNALRMVKGEDSTQLIESFTAEMTLVAEGLCEDQNKLRGEVNRMMNEEDRRLQRQESLIQELEAMLEQHQKEYDRTLKEMRERLAAVEKQLSAQEKQLAARNREEKNKKERHLTRDLTILILVAAAAVIAVTLVIKLV